MRRIRHICLACIALLLAAAGVLSCTFRELNADVPMLNIWVYVDEPVMTKATEGEIAAISEAEKAVHTLQIWVFRHSDGVLVAYLAPPTEGLSTGGEKRFSTTIQSEFADAAAAGGLSVDVYALANAASIGASYDRTTARSTLAAATMTGNVFGTSTLIGPSDITTNGLPMSAVETLTMTGSDLSYTIPSVTLTRAVSKVRFVFCQTGEYVNGVFQPSGNFTLGEMRLGTGTGKIAETEYVFNDSANEYKVGSTYSSDFVVPQPSSIPLVQNPMNYVYNNQSAQTYENLINQNVEGGTLSQVGPFYFRESDKALTGTINYTVDNVAVTKTFSMAADGDFARNHSWIVYAYFSDGKLYIHPVIADWNLMSTIEYTTKIVTGLQGAEPYRRYDTDSDPTLYPYPNQPSDPAYQNWAGSHVLVSYGYMDSNDNPVTTPGVNDRPMYSRRILLYTWAPGTDFQLNVNNPNFKFVTYDEATQTYDHSLAGGEPLIITGSDYINHDVDPPVLMHGVAYTYFYVTPVSMMPVDATLEQRTCHVYLTTVATSIGSVKLAFNNSALPGYSGASDEIWFYYTGPDVYSTTGIAVDPNN